MFNNLITKISYVMQNVLYKCKLSGTVAAELGTARQTFLAYNRATGELIGSTVWDDVTKTFELYIQEHVDEGVMLTRRDEGGVYFAETYDRLSLCTVTNTPNEFHDELMDLKNKKVLFAKKSSIISHPYTAQFENLKKVDGTFYFPDNETDPKFQHLGEDTSLNKKFRGCVYADNEILIYTDGNIRFGAIDPAMQIDPFSDGSLLACYPMVTNGVDCKGVNNATDFDSDRFVYGGYYFDKATNANFVTPFVINRSGYWTIVFDLSLYNYNAYHTEIFVAPGLFKLTLYNNVFYMYNISGTTWSSVAAYTIPTAVYATRQVAVTISPTGNDKLFVDSCIRATKAVGIPTVQPIEHLAFNGFRTSAVHRISIKNVYIFNRELSSHELSQLRYNNISNRNVPSQSKFNPIAIKDSSISLVGVNLNSSLKHIFDFSNNFSDKRASIGNYSACNGVLVYPDFIKFNGTTGSLFRSNILHWSDPDDAFTITTATNVSKLHDKSGSGTDLIQATGAQQPSRQTGVVNGKAVLRYDGADDNMAFPVNKLPYSPISVFHVQKTTTDTKYLVFTCPANQWAICIENGNNTIGIGVTSNSAQLSIDGVQIPSIVTRTETYNAFKDKTCVVSLVGLDVSYWDGFKVNGYSGYTGVFDIGELVIVPGYAKPQLAQAIEGYLAHRAGTQGALPAGHPWKAAPPSGNIQQIVDQYGDNTNTLDTSNLDFMVKFQPLSVSVAQCIWKFGNATEGLSLGIDSSGYLKLYTRNSNVLTSKSFTSVLVIGRWYRFILKGDFITLLDSNDAVIESIEHGLTIAYYIGSEALGASYGGSVISGTTGTSEFFNGFINEVSIAEKNSIFNSYTDSSNSISVWDGGTELPVEVVKWNPGTREGVLWTRVKLTPGSGKDLLVSSSIPPQKSGLVGTENAEKVWDDNFVAVYHMINDDKLTDSTSNKFDGLLYGIDDINFIPHTTGWQLSLNGVDEYVKVKYPLLSDSQRASISILASYSSVSDGDRLLDISLGDSQDSSQQLAIEFDALSKINASLYSTDHLLIGSVTSDVNDEYDHLTTVNYTGKTESGSLSMSVDSSIVDESVSTGKRVAYNSSSLYIGRDAYAETYTQANIAELFLSNKQRSIEFDNILRLSVKDQLGEYEAIDSTSKTFIVTIPQGLISSDLTDFPLCVDFVPGTELIYPDVVNSSTVLATSTFYPSSYSAYFAVRSSSSLIGNADYNEWFSTSNTNQKFNIDYGTEFISNKMLLENHHAVGNDDNMGIKNFIIYGTNSQTAFENTTYADTTGLTLLGEFQAREHIASNTSDPQYFYFDNTTAYRYYILRISDNYGYPSYMSFRRVSFYKTTGPDLREQLFSSCSDPLKLVAKQGNENLPIEIQRWDSTAKKVILHIKVPSVIASLDTSIGITVGDDINSLVGYAGSTAAQGVWDSGFKAVYHMTQDPSVGGACILDSTSNSNHAIPYGGMNTGNMIDGGGLTFDGVDDYISKSSFLNFFSNSYVGSVEFVSGGPFLISNDRSNNNNGAGLIDLGSDGVARYYRIDMGSTPPYAHWIDIGPNAILSRNYVAISSNGETLPKILRHNDVSVSEVLNFAYAGSDFTTLDIGRMHNYTYGTSYYSGILYELRVSSVARSEDWLKLSHLCLTSSSNRYELNTGEQRVYRITVDNTNILSDLIDFPLAINFIPKSELSYPSVFDETTCKATSYENETYMPHRGVDNSLSVINAWNTGAWSSLSATNQKFSIDYGSPKASNKMLLENMHSNGGNTDLGIKNFIIYGTNSQTAFENTTYADTTDLVELGTFQARQHIGSNVSDPQYFYFNNKTAYRYYVLRIADSWNAVTPFGFRRISFYSNIEEDIRPEIFSKCSDGHYLLFKNGETVLQAELDYYDIVNETCMFFVKVPTISTSEPTIIDVTIDPTNTNTDITGTTIAESVWTNGFAAVYHTTGDISSGLIDSTSNHNNGTLVNTGITSQMVLPFGNTIKFNGTYGCYVSIPHSSSLNITTAITVESIVFQNAIAAWTTLLAKGYDQTYEIKSNGGFGWRIQTTGSGNSEIELSYDDYKWQYLAGTFISGSSISYKNGVQIASAAPTGNIKSTSSPILLGTDSSSYNFTGNATEIRISNINRSAAWIKATNHSLMSELCSYEAIDIAAGDTLEILYPIDEYDKLIIHSDSSEVSTVFTDSSNNSLVISAFGNTHHNPNILSYISKSMIKFDGNGDYLRIPGAGFELLTGDFTFDAKIYLLDYPSAYSDHVFGTYTYGSVDGGTQNAGWQVGIDSTGHIIFMYGNDGSATNFVSTGVVPLKTITDISIERFNGTLTFYINGKQWGSSSASDNISKVKDYFYVGAYNRGDTPFDPAYSLNGYLSELRISIGTARHKTEYSVPTCMYGEYPPEFAYNNVEILNSALSSVITAYQSAGNTVTFTNDKLNLYQTGADLLASNAYFSGVKLKTDSKFKFKFTWYPVDGYYWYDDDLTDSLNVVYLFNTDLTPSFEGYERVSNAIAPLYLRSTKSGQITNIGHSDPFSYGTKHLVEWEFDILNSTASLYMDSVLIDVYTFSGLLNGVSYVSLILHWHGYGSTSTQVYSDFVFSQWTEQNYSSNEPVYDMVPYVVPNNDILSYITSYCTYSSNISGTGDKLNLNNFYEGQGRAGCNAVLSHPSVVKVSDKKLSISFKWYPLAGDNWYDDDFSDAQNIVHVLKADPTFSDSSVPWTYALVNNSVLSIYLRSTKSGFINNISTQSPFTYGAEHDVKWELDFQENTSSLYMDNVIISVDSFSPSLFAAPSNIKFCFHWHDYGTDTQSYKDIVIHNYELVSGEIGNIVPTDFSFKIPDLVTSELDVPIMLRIGQQAGVTVTDNRRLFDFPLVSSLRYTGVNPIIRKFGSMFDGISDFDLPSNRFEYDEIYKYRKCLRFNGLTSSVLDVTSAVTRTLLVGSVTLSMRIFPEYISSAEVVLFGSGSEFQLSYTSGNGLLIFRHTSTGITATHAIIQYRWNHIIVRRDVIAKTITIDLDGLRVYGPTAYTTNPSISGSTIYIGGNASYAFNGKISDVRVYSKILTDTECSYLFNDAADGVYNGGIVTAILKQNVPVLLGESLDSIKITDNTSDTTDIKFNAWYSLSSDDLTYQVYTGEEWKPIATLDQYVHGFTGESSPYYWDADTEEWVYINDSIEAAISAALIYPDNRMSKDIVNALSSFPFDSSSGIIQIATSLYSEGDSNPTISDININDTNIWVSDEFILSDFCSIVTSSKIDYSFNIPDNAKDYKSATKIYCLVTGGTQWVECTNGAISNIPVGLDTTGKSAWFKVVWDLNVWSNPVDVLLELEII